MKLFIKKLRVTTMLHVTARAVTPRRLQITLGTHLQRTLTADWIIDNADESRDPTTNQKIINAGFDISKALEIANVKTNKQHLCIEWNNNTQSTIDLNWLQHTLQSSASSSSSSISNFDPLSSALRSYDKIPRISYDSVINTEQGIHQWTKELISAGVCIIENAPIEDHIVTKTASRIAKPTETLYGSIFDVRTEINPINIAYTNAGLRPHQDLAYYESPPFIQMLHCMQFDKAVTGGNSTFVDTFVLADLLRQENVEAFNVLCTIPATFQKDHVDRENPAQFFYRRPHIVTNGSNDVNQVFWSPAFEGPLHMDDATALSLGYQSEADAVEAYYEGYRAFTNLLMNQDIMNDWELSFRANEGEILTFNQRRMLHGREKFQGSGQRHFQGCYIGEGEFLSKHRVLDLKYGNGIRGIESVARVGNGCHR